MQNYIANCHQALYRAWLRHRQSGIPGFALAPYLGQGWTSSDGDGAVRVLTLGLNPSYIESILVKHWELAPGIDPAVRAQGLSSALVWPPACSSSMWDQVSGAIVALDHYSRAVYGVYYRPLERLVREAGYDSGWLHLDAFPLRETDQKALEPYLPVGPRSASLPEPLSELLDITMNLVLQLKPEVVVVANSRLAQVLERVLPLALQPNGHRYEWSRLPGVPFLLGSQLSGGATSRYAYQRLVCDLKDIRLGGNGLRSG